MQIKPTNSSFFLSLLCCVLWYPLLLTDPVSAQSIGHPVAEVHPGKSRLRQLATQADLITLGTVIKVDSFWSADGHKIESKTTLKLTHRLKGNAADEIEVYTTGGFIAEENLGMMEMHEASFSAGEEVLIFARPHADGHKINGHKIDGYRIVGDAAGKYQITGASFLNHQDASRGSLQNLLDNLESVLHKRNQARSIRPSANLSQHNWLTDIAQDYFVTSGHRKWSASDAQIPFFVNVNTHQAGLADGTRAEFLRAIRNATKTWNNVAEANLSLHYAGSTEAESIGYNGYNEVLFMNKGIGERGAVAQVWYRRDLTLVEADIWINDDYDWNASGPLEFHELDLESVLLHEFGHWLVLGHLADEDTVMYRSVSRGVVKRVLHSADEQGISAIYPCLTERC